MTSTKHAVPVQNNRAEFSSRVSEHHSEALASSAICVLCPFPPNIFLSKRHLQTTGEDNGLRIKLTGICLQILQFIITLKMSKHRPG